MATTAAQRPDIAKCGYYGSDSHAHRCVEAEQFAQAVKQLAVGEQAADGYHQRSQRREKCITRQSSPVEGLHFYMLQQLLLLLWGQRAFTHPTVQCFSHHGGIFFAEFHVSCP
ncbi:hypothetical protein D3C78_1326210 [compost metagenome]